MDPVYIPEQYQLIWTVFDPALGREQKGRRPALVLSDSLFNERTGLAIVSPITSRVRPFPTSVILPLGLPVAGEILLSHVKSIDFQARPVSWAGAAISPATVAQVRAKLCGIFTL